MLLEGVSNSTSKETYRHLKRFSGAGVGECLGPMSQPLDPPMFLMNYVSTFSNIIDVIFRVKILNINIESVAYCFWF